jgi:hypothetical protein
MKLPDQHSSGEALHEALIHSGELLQVFLAGNPAVSREAFS